MGGWGGGMSLTFHLVFGQVDRGAVGEDVRDGAHPPVHERGADRVHRHGCDPLYPAIPGGRGGERGKGNLGWKASDENQTRRDGHRVSAASAASPWSKGEAKSCLARRHSLKSI